MKCNTTNILIVLYLKCAYVNLGKDTILNIIMHREMSLGWK